eukprot:scaffold117607_cov23-Prasinocladus_malaysianus.AAC.1
MCLITDIGRSCDDLVESLSGNTATFLENAPTFNTSMAQLTNHLEIECGGFRGGSNLPKPYNCTCYYISDIATDPLCDIGCEISQRFCFCVGVSIEPPSPQSTHPRETSQPTTVPKISPATTRLQPGDRIFCSAESEL